MLFCVLHISGQNYGAGIRNPSDKDYMVSWMLGEASTSNHLAGVLIESSYYSEAKLKIDECSNSGCKISESVSVIINDILDKPQFTFSNDIINNLTLHLSNSNGKNISSVDIDSHNQLINFSFNKNFIYYLTIKKGDRAIKKYKIIYH